MRKTFILAAAPLVLLGACHKAATAPAADDAAVLDAIHAVESGQIKAINAGDMAGATAVYAPGAQFVFPGEGPVTGTDKLTAAFTRMKSDPAFAVTMTDGTKRHWIAASGNMAVTSFSGTMTETVNGKVVTRPVDNQTLWIKQSDGKWKIESDFNAFAGPPEPPPAASSSTAGS